MLIGQKRIKDAHTGLIIEDDVDGLEQDQKPDDDKDKLEGCSKRRKVDSCRLDDGQDQPKQAADLREEENKQV